MDNIFDTLFGIFNSNYDTCEKIDRTIVGNYTVDTCYTVDQGWETAVWKDDHPMIIVARYETREQAKAGHEDWCAACRLNPTSAWSVQLDAYIVF